MARHFRRFGLSVVVGVFLTGVGEAPRPAQAAVTLEAARPTSTPMFERALVIHDAPKGLEHLVEEFTFAAGDQPLGLLLPVPARPTVSKLKSSPFAKLASASEAVTGSGFGSSTPGRVSGPPEVPPPDQVGRVATSVIAASDSGALKKWLAKNKLAADAALDTWLASYAARGFYFVALQVEPKPQKEAFKLVTETLQISFASPLPYFPYTEPLENLGTRLLSVWLLSNARQVPVALASAGSTAQWLRPWHELDSWRPSPTEVKALLPQPLVAVLPRGPAQNTTLVRYPEYTLQHFEDQKSSRLGYGDVVLVPEVPREPPQASPDLRRLMGVLDPEVKP